MRFGASSSAVSFSPRDGTAITQRVVFRHQMSTTHTVDIDCLLCCLAIHEH